MSKPTDESRAQSSTGEESCPICDGSGTRDDDEGRSCSNCDGSGTVRSERRRKAHIDPTPTIAPGTMRLDCDDRDGCPCCGKNNGTHWPGCSMPDWIPVVLQHARRLVGK